MGLSAVVVYQRVNHFVFDLPEALRVSESVENNLKTHLFELSGSKKLILATLKHYEIFEKKSEMTLFNKRLKLPDIVVSASMPVEYNYYVDFDGTWDIFVNENTIRVIAPDPKAVSPSVSVSEIEFGVVKGSFFRRDSIVTEELRLELDQLLMESSSRHVSSIIEVARRELYELVKLWLHENQQDLEIQILFQNEVTSISKG